MAKGNISITLDMWAINKLDSMTKLIKKETATDWSRSSTVEYLIRKLHPIEYLEFLAKEKAAEFYKIKELLDNAKEIKEKEQQQTLNEEQLETAVSQ